MFDNPKKDLRWLEAQLLAEEDSQEEDTQELFSEEDWLEEELREAHVLLGDSAPARQRRTDVFAFLEEDTEEEELAVYADAPRQASPSKTKIKKKEKGIGGLVFLACMETAAIIAIMLWWVIWLL